MGKNLKKNIHSSEKEYINKTKGFPGDSDDNESPAMQEFWVQSLVPKVPWRQEWLATPVFFLA